MWCTPVAAPISPEASLQIQAPVGVLEGHVVGQPAYMCALPMSTPVVPALATSMPHQNISQSFSACAAEAEAEKENRPSASPPAHQKTSEGARKFRQTPGLQQSSTRSQPRSVHQQFTAAELRAAVSHVILSGMSGPQSGVGESE